MVSPVKTTRSSAPVTDADIDAIESAFGIRFPAALREQYKAYNGGVPERCEFPFRDEIYEVESFLAIGTVEKPELERLRRERAKLGGMW